MIDIFDVIAFVVFAVLILAVAGVVVGLGVLPGLIARKRNHPQVAAVNIASWVGIATLGVLWPLALIWAFMKSPEPAAASSPEGGDDLVKMQSRVTAMETALRELNSGKEVQP